MGNSGKLAVVAAFVSLGLLALAATLLEEVLLYLFLAAVAVCYLASMVQVFNRRRYVIVFLGAAGTSLFIGFSIAFLRIWGLAFRQDGDAMGSAVSSTDSDIYFYLAALAGCGTLALMFLGAVLPSFGSRAAAAPKRAVPAAKRTPAARKPAARSTSGKSPTSGKSTTSSKSPTSSRPTNRPATPRKTASKR
ncbi:hypothetical protein [Arthrobacter sp. fls2-241-R2A-200]|uniref:hypothetical protein n=1 Tax=Arthrobacter sp. fls2-241-R2A-200 TaxID=3040281 RepID=UPI00254AA65D|nr:hypothetical protein [Arthrobacter sp. fls2-241-R2A-200]